MDNASTVTAHASMDSASTTVHLQDVCKQYLEPRKQPNPKKTYAERQDAKHERASKQQAMKDDIKLEIVRQQQAAKDLGAKHGVHPDDMLRLIHQASAFAEKRDVNAWNAYIHLRAHEVNQGLYSRHNLERLNC